jgi:hypothetical protein
MKRLKPRTGENGPYLTLNCCMFFAPVKTLVRLIGNSIDNQPDVLYPNGITGSKSKR